MTTVILESVLTCPHCGVAAQETMPQDACLFFYECNNCKALMRPKGGRLLRVLLFRLRAMSAEARTV